jgi:hypothetical protein
MQLPDHATPAALADAAKELALCTLQVCMHTHSHTCKKHGFKGTDEDCRMTMPRPLQRASEFDKDTGAVYLRRDAGMLVSHMPALVAADPCNNAVYAMCEASNYKRELWLHGLQLAAGNTEHPAPVLAPSETRAAERAEYTLKYVCKFDHVVATHKVTAMADRLARIQSQTDPGQQRAVKILGSMMHQLNGATAFPAALISLYLQGFGDHFMSHKTQAHSYHVFTGRLLQGCQHTLAPDANGRDEECVQPVPGLRFCGVWEDFEQRPLALSHLGPYHFTMLYRKNKLSEFQVHERETRAAEEEEWGGRTRTEGAVYGPDMEDEGQEEEGAVGQPDLEGIRTFLPAHQQHLTHELLRRRILVLPQMFRNPPARPSTDAAAPERDSYAAFALGNFASDRPTETVHDGGLAFNTPLLPEDPPGTLWKRLLRWELCTDALSRHGRQVLHNMHMQACAQASSREHLKRHTEEREQVDEWEASRDNDDERACDADDPHDGAASEGAHEEHSQAGDSTCPPAATDYTRAQQDLQDRMQRLNLPEPATDKEVGVREYEEWCMGPAAQLPTPSVRVQHSQEVCQKLSDGEHLALQPAAAAAAVDQVAAELRARQVRQQAAPRLEWMDTDEDEAGPVPPAGHTPGTDGPPYTRLATPPSPEASSRLFTLSPDQHACFMRLATALHTKMHQEAGGQAGAGEQIRMVLMGQAGCGKSQVMKAFMWHAWQHGRQQHIKLCSFQWRAARGSSTPAVQGVSTSHLFGMNPLTGKTTNPAVRARVGQAMQEAWFIINDECSLNSAAHFANCSHAASEATRQPLDVPFGGIHTVMAGDMMQHAPVGGTPLYKEAGRPAPPPALGPPLPAAAHAPATPDAGAHRKPLKGKAKAGTAAGQRGTGDSCGSQLWEQFNDVYLLEQQHRQDDSIPQHRGCSCGKPPRLSQGQRSTARCCSR